MADIVMPRLSDTMEEGTILRWLKGNGELLARGDELVEIETDKANMTYESDQAGVLQILAAVGDTLPVGQVIARVSGSAAGGASSPEGEDGAGGASVEVKDEEGASVRGERAAASGADERVAASTPRPGEPPAGGDSGRTVGRVKASPLARRIAGESGIDLRSLTGSGPGGRIVKADVQAAPADARAGEAGAAPTERPGETHRPCAPRAPRRPSAPRAPFPPGAPRGRRSRA